MPANMKLIRETVRPDGQRRVRFYRREDGLFTYFEEERRYEPGPLPEYDDRADPANYYWGDLRGGGVFASAQEAERDAASATGWIG